MVVGIDLSVMTQVGVSIEEFHLGIMEYPVDGEMIIETTFGEDIRGTIVIYITVISKETGEPGIIPIIGIDQNIASLHITTMEDCITKDRIEVALKGNTIKGNDRIEVALKGNTIKGNDRIEVALKGNTIKGNDRIEVALKDNTIKVVHKEISDKRMLQVNILEAKVNILQVKTSIPNEQNWREDFPRLFPPLCGLVTSSQIRGFIYIHYIYFCVF